MASSSLLPYRWASLAARLPAAPSQRVERIALFDSYDRRSAGQLTVDDLRRGLIATLERVQTHPDADAVARWLQPVLVAGVAEACGLPRSAARLSSGGRRIDRREFRLLLLYLQRHAELLKACDADGVRGSLRLPQYVAALPLLAEMGVAVPAEPAAHFLRLAGGDRCALPLSTFVEWAMSEVMAVLRARSGAAPVADRRPASAGGRSSAPSSPSLNGSHLSTNLSTSPSPLPVGAGRVYAEVAGVGSD